MFVKLDLLFNVTSTPKYHIYIPNKLMERSRIIIKTLYCVVFYIVNMVFFGLVGIIIVVKYAVFVIVFSCKSFKHLSLTSVMFIVICHVHCHLLFFIHSSI